MENKSFSGKPVKICYEHIGGKLGQLLVENFADKSWIAKIRSTDKNFYFTELGQKEFEKLGIDITQIKLEEL